MTSGVTPTGVVLERTRGWRMPARTITVARCGLCIFCGGRRTGVLRGIAARRPCFGNPFTVAGALESGYATTVADAQQLCADAFESWLNGEPTWAFAHGQQRLEWLTAHLVDLRGYNLGCWCKLDRPCHRNTLLRVANA